MNPNSMSAPINDRVPVYLLLLAFVSYGRVLFMQDIFWDDNCWLEAIYSSSNLNQFLNTGFVEMRRVPLGTLFYYFFEIHKLTDHAVLIWQVINLSIQIITPVLIYRLATNLSSGNRTLGTAVAVFFIVLPLDHTLPYLSAINYRFGLLLSILSLLLSERAVVTQRTRWKLLMASLGISLFTQYTLTESAVALEPARALIFWHYLRKHGFSQRDAIIRAVKLFAIFLAGMLPLIFYKILYPPFGMYAGIYKTDIFGLLNWKEHARLAWISLRGLWIVLLKQGQLMNLWSITLGVTTALLAFIYLRRKHIFSIPGSEHNVRSRWIFTTRPYSFLLLFGIAVVLLQHFMFAMAGRPLTLGADSSHAALTQIGYALIGGVIVLSLLSRFSVSPSRHRVAHSILATFIGLGIFFNNVNLDLYAQGSARQALFWKTFIERFPSLPREATLFIDATDNFFFYTSDIDNTYDLELYLNLLYAPNVDAASFRRYRVFSIEDEFREIVRNHPNMIVDNKPITRISHFGLDVLDPRSFIVVRYRDGEMLVNDEILKKYPDVPYAAWARKPIPDLPPRPSSYPLRAKSPGLF